MHLPLPGGDVGRVDVALLEPREPQLHWRSRVAVRGTEDDLQTQMPVVSTALVRLVVGSL